MFDDVFYMVLNLVVSCFIKILNVVFNVNGRLEENLILFVILNYQMEQFRILDHSCANVIELKRICLLIW